MIRDKVYIFSILSPPFTGNYHGHFPFAFIIVFICSGFVKTIIAHVIFLSVRKISFPHLSRCTKELPIRNVSVLSELSLDPPYILSSNDL